MGEARAPPPWTTVGATKPGTRRRVPLIRDRTIRGDAADVGDVPPACKAEKRVSPGAVGLEEPKTKEALLRWRRGGWRGRSTRFAGGNDQRGGETGSPGSEERTGLRVGRVPGRVEAKNTEAAPAAKHPRRGRVTAGAKRQWQGPAREACSVRRQRARATGTPGTPWPPAKALKKREGAEAPPARRLSHTQAGAQGRRKRALWPPCQPLESRERPDEVCPGRRQRARPPEPPRRPLLPEEVQKQRGARGITASPLASPLA